MCVEDAVFKEVHGFERKSIHRRVVDRVCGMKIPAVLPYFLFYSRCDGYEGRREGMNVLEGLCGRGAARGESLINGRGFRGAKPFYREWEKTMKKNNVEEMKKEKK